MLKVSCCGVSCIGYGLDISILLFDEWSAFLAGFPSVSSTTTSADTNPKKKYAKAAPLIILI